MSEVLFPEIKDGTCRKAATLWLIDQIIESRFNEKGQGWGILTFFIRFSVDTFRLVWQIAAVLWEILY